MFFCVFLRLSLYLEGLVSVNRACNRGIVANLFADFGELFLRPSEPVCMHMNMICIFSKLYCFRYIIDCEQSHYLSLIKSVRRAFASRTLAKNRD